MRSLETNLHLVCHPVMSERPFARCARSEKVKGPCFTHVIVPRAIKWALSGRYGSNPLPLPLFRPASPDFIHLQPRYSRSDIGATSSGEGGGTGLRLRHPARKLVPSIINRPANEIGAIKTTRGNKSEREFHSRRPAAMHAARADRPTNSNYFSLRKR